MVQSDVVFQIEGTTALRPLRTIFLYTAHHLGSAIVLNAIAECPHLDIVGAIRGGAVPSTRDGRIRRAGLKQARKVGLRFALTLYGHYLAQRAALGLAGMVNPLRGRGLVPCEHIAHRRGWPILNSAHINSDETAAFIREAAPDLIVSAYFGQILAARIIALPRLGILNLHPGWLPAYRGALSYVWTLANGDPAGGVALHWMDEGLDTGPIVARRRFPLAPRATASSLMVLTAANGADLIARTAARLTAGEPIEPVDISAEDARHYPMPNLDDVRALLRQNRYFRIRDIAATLWRGPDNLPGRGGLWSSVSRPGRGV